MATKNPEPPDLDEAARARALEVLMSIFRSAVTESRASGTASLNLLRLVRFCRGVGSKYQEIYETARAAVPDLELAEWDALFEDSR